MRITEVLHENKFDGVVYYFESNGFSLVSELESFDFDLLYFVPGLDEDIVVEAIDLCKYALGHPQEAVVEEEAFEGEEEMSVVISNDNVPLVEEVEDTDDLNNIFESIVASLRQLEETLVDEASVKKVAGHIVTSLTEEGREVISIISEEICEKIASAGFSEEEIETLKGQPLADFFVNVMMGNRRCGGSLINYCLSIGKKTMWDMRDFAFDHSQIKGASEASMRACREAYEQFVKDVKAGKFRKEEPTEADHILAFVEKWNSLNENMHICAINGGRGKTLQYTADELGITRERVRQISLKVSRILRLPAKPIVETLLKEHDGAFTDDDALECFEDESIGIAFLYVIREGGCRYIKFAKKYCSYDVPSNYEQRLSDITQKYIGDGTNFLECMEEIESVMAKEGMPQLDFYDFLSYLLSCGYKMYGDFVVRRKNSYTLICYDVVSRYFPDGIKLEGTSESQDLTRLRDIVKEKYGNYELPESNHAIVARIAPMLVLCDKSTYCIADNIQYSIELIDEIVAYVNASPEPFVFYDTLFKMFQGRLLMETTINNYHCLHGVIKLLYPQDFQYERDGMTKLGATRLSLDQQITNVLLQAGRPMTREEIYKACPYAVGLRLANVAWRDPGIIQWSYNEYNHIHNVKATAEQKAMLKQVMRELTDSNYGYCNERQLYAAIYAVLPDFIEDNNITESLNLFYVLECYLKPEFRFSRPHIVSAQYPEDMPLTNINVGKYFMGQREVFSYQDYLAVAKKCAWSSSMVSAMLIELEAEYVRINETEYIAKDKFTLDAEQIVAIESAVLSSMNGEEYIALFATFANGNYPSIGYQWNEFILDSIIRNFIPSLKIIEPLMRDRRYKRGIIVEANNKCSTYEELVIRVLRKDGFESTPLDLFDDYLRNAGLLLNNVPQEILESSSLIIKDNEISLA